MNDNFNNKWGKEAYLLIEELEEKIEALKNLYSTLKNTIADCNVDIETINANWLSLNNDISGLEADVQIIQNSLNDVDSDYQELLTSIENINEDVNTIQNKLTTVQDDITNLNNELQDVENLQTFKNINCIDNELKSIHTYQEINTFYNIDARMTADSTYKIVSFKSDKEFPTKIYVTFSARAYVQGVYGSVRLDFYIDSNLIYSKEVYCEDEEELYSFEFDFFPTGEKQDFKMKMTHLNQVSGTNVRICMQYIRIKMCGKRCFFYENEGGIIAYDYQNSKSIGVGTASVYHFGNFCRYLRLWEHDAITKKLKDWNTSDYNAVSNASIPTSGFIANKKICINRCIKDDGSLFYGLNFYYVTDLGAVQVLWFNVYNKGDKMSWSLASTLGMVSIIAPVEFNNYENLISYGYNLGATRRPNHTFSMILFYKTYTDGVWKTALITDYRYATEIALVSIPETVGNVVDVFTTFNIGNNSQQFSCLPIFLNDDDDIYIVPYNLDKTKICLSSDVEYSLPENYYLVPVENETFPLYVGKGINPFACYKEDGQLYIYYSYINRIYERIFNFTNNKLSLPRFVCDGQWYSEGEFAYNVRKNGVMHSVSKCDIQK